MAVPRPLSISPASFPTTALGGACVFLMLISRALESYAGAWIAGAIAFVFIMARGTTFERALLLLLIVLSLFLGSTLGYQGLRQMLFIAVFMMLAQHVPVSPSIALAAYAAGLTVALIRTGEISVLFTVGPSVILLLAAAWQVLEWRSGSKKPGLGERARMTLILLAALALPLLGAGSRSGLVVWLGFGLRLLSVPILLLGAAGILVIASFPQIELIQRAINSYDELTDPFPEVGINLRAVEALIFVSWWQTASLREILFGSLDIIYMPGDFLGYLNDPIYVPHNQILGIYFQFGVVGFLMILIYMFKYWKFLTPFPIGRFVLFIYLGLGFVVIHGFVNQDLAIVAGVALWYREALVARRSMSGGLAHGN